MHKNTTSKEKQFENNNTLKFYCSAIEIPPLSDNQKHEQVESTNLLFWAENLSPNICPTLLRFKDNVIPLITPFALNEEYISEFFTMRLLQNAFSINKILTSNCQQLIAEVFLNSALNIRNMAEKDVDIVNKSFDGTGMIIGLLKSFFDELGYVVDARPFGEIRIFNSFTEELGIPLFYPDSLTCFEFCIGECTYKSSETLNRTLNNDGMLKLQILNQIYVTANKTLKNYSPSTSANCIKYIAELKNIRDSFEESLNLNL
ncbi:MAG: hypothetical protein ACI9LM_004242 [Alteromonadaceae bacterium]|jgi:hypothetical protein